MAVAVALAAAVVAGWFSYALLRRYSARGRVNRALVYWSIALGMFCLAALGLAAGSAKGWSTGPFRFYYLFGATLTVPWLALGTVVTLSRDRVSRESLGVVAVVVAVALGVALVVTGTPGLFIPGIVLALLWGALLLSTNEAGADAGSLALVGVFTVVALFAVVAARLEVPLPSRTLPEGSRLFPSTVRGLALGGNALGASMVVVGSGLSALRLRGKELPHLVIGNILIALGVLVAASGGLFAGLGDTQSHSIAFAIGVALMYAGFVRTTRPVVPPGIDDAPAPPAPGSPSRMPDYGVGPGVDDPRDPQVPDQRRLPRGHE